jgi:hypothetical protein
MLGFAFGSAYYLFYILQPGAFAMSGAKPAAAVPDLMYFSFITLTTLGYGDTTPVSKAARAFTELEAVAGVLYMAVFMARLVSLQSAPSVTSEPANGRGLAARSPTNLSVVSDERVTEEVPGTN